MAARVGYHESVLARSPNRARRLLPERPVRIQHRSGAMWVLNTAGIDRLGLDAVAITRAWNAMGVDARRAGCSGSMLGCGNASNRRRSIPCGPQPAARELRSHWSDGCYAATARELAAFRRAIECNELRQKLVVMGSIDLPESNILGSNAVR